MKIKLLLLTIALFLGSFEVMGQTTVFLFSFENTQAVTTDNAIGTPSFTSSGVDTPSYFAGSTGNSRSHANWQTGDYYRFTVNTTGYSSLNFSYFDRTSNTTIGSFIARVSTDASNWTTIVSSYIPGTAFAQRTAALPAGFANQTIVYIEVYKTNNAGDVGNNLRIDEALLTGTSGPDITSPTVTTLSPLDNATGVAINSNLILTFSENVVIGTGGNIVIYNSDNSVFETIPYNDGRITFNGTTGVTINPTGTFANSAAYYVQIASTAIRDVALNNYGGISNSSDWDFTIEAPITIIWTNPITGTNPSTDNPYTNGQTVNANITVSGISRGNGIIANAGPNRYNAKDWNSTTLNLNDYFEFTLTPTVGYEIDFVDFEYTSQRSGNAAEGPNNFVFRSSVDNFVAGIGTPDFNGAIISLSEEQYQNRRITTTYRFYAWGADLSGRAFSINDFTFKGAIAQYTIPTDHFRSRTTGAWSTASNWESSRDNINWITSTLVPTSAANAVTIRNLQTITISSAVTADQITVESGGTLVLNGANLTLNDGTGTDLTINSGGIFDNGGENQIIIGSGTPTINITGRFITRDVQGFVGTNTAIPSIVTVLNVGSTVEYGLAGDQAVQGSTAPTYQNVTFSGSGTKTLISANAAAGTITVTDAAILNVGAFTFGGTGTNLTMTGTSRLIVSGARQVPDMEGTYTLTGGTIEFAGNSSSHTARSPITYNNVVISGSNVNGSSGNYTLRAGATFTVNSGAVFTVSDQRIIAGGASATININGTFITRDSDGFSGTNATSISPTNIILNLEAGSTIDYAGNTQTVTNAVNYKNLRVSTTGIKTISSDIRVEEAVTVSAGELSVASDRNLIVTNNVNNSGGTITFENNASLVQTGGTTNANSGDIRYRRATRAMSNNFDFVYWASPVASTAMSSIWMAVNSNDTFYSWNNASSSWTPQLSTATLIPGRSIIARSRNGQSGTNIESAGQAYTVGSPWTALLKGVPNNGDISINIGNSGTIAVSKGDNLIGNPYPCALDLEAFYDENASKLTGVFQMWRATTAITNNAYAASDYVTYTAATGVTIGAPLTAQFLAASQGFFAFALSGNAASEIITFRNSQKVIGSNNAFLRLKGAATKNRIENHNIWLNLKNSQGINKQMVVQYAQGATLGFDERLDVKTLDGNQYVDFYSTAANNIYTLQSRPLPFTNTDVVPLGFKTTVAGAYSIAIDKKNGLFVNQKVYLQDNLLNKVHDLVASPYPFSSAKGTFNSRFVLKYFDATLGVTSQLLDDNDVIVATENANIIVKSANKSIDKVKVYDMLGRIIFEKQQVNASHFNVESQINDVQVVIVKVILVNGSTVSKKVIVGK